MRSCIYWIILASCFCPGFCLFYMNRLSTSLRTRVCAEEAEQQDVYQGDMICEVYDCENMDSSENKMPLYAVNECIERAKENFSFEAAWFDNCLLYCTYFFLKRKAAKNWAPCVSRKRFEQGKHNCEFFDISTCTEHCLLGYSTDDNNCVTSCNCKEEGLFEGDILLSKMDVARIKDIETNKAASKLLVKPRWNNLINEDGRYNIPYAIHPRLKGNYNARTFIEGALKDFNESTCVQFIDFNPEQHSDYLAFVHGERGCYSFIGRKSGRQEVELGDMCHDKDIVIHELMHALGFWHEHTRPDRDKNVEILFNNIKPKKKGNFCKKSWLEVDSMRSPYDTSSIMHYHGCSFSAAGFPTIVDKHTKKVVMPRKTVGLSVDDLCQLNMMYSCSKYPEGGTFCKLSNSD